MTKKKQSESKIWWSVPLFGLMALIGATMAIFGVQYGEQIAIAGALWFTASFVVAMFYFAMKSEIEERKKEKRK